MKTLSLTIPVGEADPMGLGSSSLQAFGDEIAGLAQSEKRLFLVGFGFLSGPNGIGHEEANLTFRFSDLDAVKKDFERIFVDRNFPVGTRLVETTKNEDLSFTHNELIVIEG